MELFLAIQDQSRYIIGLITILFLLSHFSLERREGYAWRLIGAGTALWLLAMAYLPLARLQQTLGGGSPLFMAPYWLFMSFAPLGYVLLCWKTTPEAALFRLMVASFVENIVTVLVRYLGVGILMPGLSQAHPALYTLFMIACYALVYGVFWQMVRRLPRRELTYEKKSGSQWADAPAYVIYTTILANTKVAFEYILQPLAGRAELADVYLQMRLFLILVMTLLSVVMLILQWNAYRRLALQNDKQVLLQMARQRESQYEFSKENIEMINRKCHDLKHQLRALEQVSDDERRAQLRQARQAVDFYDAVVKTGNDALDTLLTEKSVYCQNRSIRLSCMVSTHYLSRIGLVDLYTLLGNALDNAIESVERLASPEKKTISLTIRDQGRMLYLQVENYYEGTIAFEDGLPQTQKDDRENHGFGVRSIRSIARAYGGEMYLSADGELFLLQVVIPGADEQA